MKTIYDLIIIGGGPAGVTAGIYAGRQKLNTLLITKDFGGQTARKAVDIENYPGFGKISGLDLAKKFEEHLKMFARPHTKHSCYGVGARQNLGGQVEIKKEEVVRVEKKGKNFLVSTAGKNKYEAYAVIVASGGDPRPLEVVGEKEFLGRGVSYCAVCDGPVFRDKTVAVIGGGNSGFEAAIFLANYIKKIYILEALPEVAADQENQDLVKKTGKAEIITNAVVKRIEGENFVNSIVYQDLKTKKESTLKVEGVFVEIGIQPATSFVKDLVEFNKRDEIMVEFETCQTKTPGLYAVGDANVGKYKQIVTACGEGAKAALAAYGYLQNLKYKKD